MPIRELKSLEVIPDAVTVGESGTDLRRSGPDATARELDGLIRALAADPLPRHR